MSISWSKRIQFPGMPEKGFGLSLPVLLWLPSPSSLLLWVSHMTFSCCLIHWVSEAPCLRKATQWLRRARGDWKGSQSQAEQQTRDWNVPAMFKPVVSPWRMKEVIDPRAVLYPTSKRNRCRAASFGKKTLAPWVPCQDLKACIFKFTSRTTLREESGPYQVYHGCHFIPVSYLNNNTSTPKAGTSKVQKIWVPWRNAF